MPTADPYPKVKRAIVKLLKEAVEPHGFSQVGTTVYFVRDRSTLRDVFFFQKMRSNAICICYGVGPLPSDTNWEPSAPNGRWLNNQEFYRCKYLAHVENSIGRAIADFEAEALPWFNQFQTVPDLPTSPNR